MLQQSLRQKVEQLRQKGKTYSEIMSLLKTVIPKSTLSYWCRNITVPTSYHSKVKKLNAYNLAAGRKISSNNRKEARKSFLENVDVKNNKLLESFSKDIDSRKIALVILYLGEGSKTARGSLMFGNSDPAVVSMFVNLMRECYKLDERKFRCTLQCRADQDIEKLEKFWSKTTKISRELFYTARVDKRSFGQISEKRDYKGVCRIDYFSSAIDLELKRLAQKMLESFR
ncbi:MAG: hypothetical protein PHD04_03205 [Candidatus Pacebacteria bacterium]|nr:hypothetical protein [Candidatus Paceibacterota bacterium]